LDLLAHMLVAVDLVLMVLMADPVDYLVAVELMVDLVVELLL